jgi:hypothetical protein
MADITMCDDALCPNAGKCYRFTAPIADYNQSWFIKSPLKKDKSCDQFWLDERHIILRRNK